MFESWPFTNFHDMNLDWIVRRIKNVETSEANAKASEEAAKASEEAAALSAADSEQSANNASSSAEAAANDKEYISDAAAQIAANTARIDNLVANAGDTDGNAELLDIRVGYSGHTYATAGDAVRGQTGTYWARHLKSYVFNNKDPQIGKYYNNLSANTWSGDNTRVSALGGIDLRGATAFSITPKAGYQWTAKLVRRTAPGTYTDVITYSGWHTGAMIMEPVAAGATHLFFNIKNDSGTTITDQPEDTFTLKLFDAYPQIVEFTGDNEPCPYYGFYQYVTGVALNNDRKTPDCFYDITNYNCMILNVKANYGVSVTMFDSEFNVLGNLGVWVTGTRYTDFRAYHSGAVKYVTITAKTMDGSPLDNTYDFYSFTPFTIKHVQPVASNELKLEYVDSYSVSSSDIAMYDDLTVLSDTGALFVNDVSYTIEVGHGNNIQFGTELHGTYPYLYSGRWYRNEHTIYEIEFSNTGVPSPHRAITVTGLPEGYLNMCFDGDNKLFYIVLEKGVDTYQGDVELYVADFNGNVLTSHAMNIKIPVIQGMKYYNDQIVITSGIGSAAYPNYITVLNLEGKCLARSKVNDSTELEGIEIYNNEMYIKYLNSLYKI